MCVSFLFFFKLMYFWTVIYFWWFVLFLHYSIRFALLSVCTVMALLQSVGPQLSLNWDKMIKLLHSKASVVFFHSFQSTYCCSHDGSTQKHSLFFLSVFILALNAWSAWTAVWLCFSFVSVFCMLLRRHWLLQCEIFVSVPMWKYIFKLFEWIKNAGKSVVCEFLCFSCLKIKAGSCDLREVQD